MIGPCAKGIVKATLIAKNGRHYVGFNDCRKPQKTCARGGMPSGVGYHLCREVCDQTAHAEVNAIKQAGDDAIEATIYLEGHIAPCTDCAARIAEVQASVIVGPPPPFSPRG